MPVGPVPRPLLPDDSEVRDGRLAIGGCDVIDLTAEHGTPLFVYAEDDLRRRCGEAVAAFGEGVAYAAKAFLCTAMARLAHEEGMWIDVATGGELHVALRAGVPAERLILHGNNKSFHELEMALGADVGRVVIDSMEEIDRIERLVASGHRVPRVLVRVNPGIDAHTHEYLETGRADSKFGFGLASGAAADAVDRLRSSSTVCRQAGSSPNTSSAPKQRAGLSCTSRSVWRSAPSTDSRRSLDCRAGTKRAKSRT